MRAAIEKWIGERPENTGAWAHAGHVLGLIGQANSVTNFPSNRVEQASKPRPERKSTVTRWASVAAAAALLAVLSPQIALRWQADHMTAIGEQRTLTLEDGSTVRLAPGSAIGVDYANGHRHVRLLSGEAYFEVMRDPSRPFEVTAQTAKVTVLGTGFNVRMSEDGADVAVRHGRVRVDYPDGRPPVSSVLVDGQWTRLAWNGDTKTGTTSPTLVGGWAVEQLWLF